MLAVSPTGVSGPPSTALPPSGVNSASDVLDARPRFWVLGDTQFNNIAAITTRTHSPFVKFFAHAAIRPPTLDLWSETVLRDILGAVTADLSIPILFLGDGANTSCVQEYWRFLRTMDRAQWVGVLGNHDGYYMGNYTWGARSGERQSVSARYVERGM